MVVGSVMVLFKIDQNPIKIKKHFLKRKKKKKKSPMKNFKQSKIANNLFASIIHKYKIDFLS